MNQIYLIDHTSFARYEDISVNIKPERLKTFIKKAQDLDLKPFIGNVLYYDLLKHFSADIEIDTNAPQAYKDLVNGSEYLDEEGHIVLYEGLMPMLVYYTLARFIEGNAVQHTATGPVFKGQEQGNGLSPSDTAKLVQRYRSIANAYANGAEQFLWDHQHDVPLWKYDGRNKTSRQPGPRIRGINRTDFNLPTHSGKTNNHLQLTEFLN